MQLKLRNRIVDEGVDTQRYDDGIRRKFAQSFEGKAERVEPGGRIALQTKRQVEIETVTGTLATFVRVAEEKRVFLLRVAVNRDEQDVAASIEDRLRAVAVMVIDIENRDAFGAAVDEVLCGDRGIIEETIAAEVVSSGMVARRAAQRKDPVFTVEENLGAGQCHVGGGCCGVPGAGRNRCARIERVVRQLAVDVLGLDRPHATNAPVERQGVAFTAGTAPLIPCAAKEFEVPAVVDTRQRFIAKF